MNAEDAGARVSHKRRAWLTVELLALYVGAPIALYSLVHFHRVPLFTVMLPLSVLFILVLTLQRTFSWRETLTTGVRFRDLAGILATFAIAAPLLAAYAWAVIGPRGFLFFPRALPHIWLMVMVLYPLISVTAQELMFRVFFFHRYRPLFASDGQAAVALNAVLFSFGHIIFGALPSLVISFFGGILFAWRYERTRSYWAVVIEHALYGNLIFTLGLGRYFYTGVANF